MLPREAGDHHNSSAPAATVGSPYIRRDVLQFFGKCVQEVPSGQIPLLFAQFTDLLTREYLPALEGRGVGSSKGDTAAAAALMSRLEYIVKVFAAFVRNVVITDSNSRSLAAPIRY